MKKLVVKKELNLGFGKMLKEGQVAELQCVEGINYKILVPEVGIGIFDEEEFNTYFEEHKETKQKEEQNIHINGLSEKIKVIRSNNATVVILEGGIKGVSKCLEEDAYDKVKGFEIAYTKACIKRLNKNLKELIK